MDLNLFSIYLFIIVFPSLPHLFPFSQVLAANVPAHFVEKSSLVSLKRGETARLVCEAFGSKPISVTWFKQQLDGDLAVVPLDGSLVAGQSYRVSPRFTSFEKDFEGNDQKTIFELHIIAVQLNDSALYVCKGVNEYGEDARNVQLTVLDVPSSPENIQVDQIWSRSASVRWLSPKNDGNGLIRHYVVQYWRDSGTSGSSSSSSHRLYEEVVSAPVNAYVVRDKLSPGTAYSLRVLGQNQFGRGPASLGVKFMTKEEQPDSPPIDISADSRGTTVLRIKWKAPPKTHWNGQLKGYHIGYRIIGDNDDINQPENVGQIEEMFTFKQVPFSGIANDNYQQEFILTGLQKASTYSLVAKAYNGAGSGPLSQQIITSTSNNDPPSAPALWVTSVTDGSIRLKWDQKSNTHDLTHYVLYYKDDRSPWLEIAFAAPEEQEYELKNVEKGTWYQLYMKAMSKRGPSDPSEVLTIRTEGENSLEVSIERNEGVGVQQVPPYLRSIVVIPIACAIVIIVIACASAYAYIKFEERKAALLQVGMAHILSQSPSKNFQYISGGSSSSHSRNASIVSEEGSLTLRYSDSSDKCRPLLARPPVPTVLWAQSQGPILEENEDFPSPYATLPLKLTTFNSPAPPPRLPPDNPRRFSGQSGERNILCHTPPDTLERQDVPSTSANHFCKAEVHHQDGSYLYDDFFKHQL